ncbi:MAG: DUF4340 domain-containing protein [Gemmatimonadetes bacterium]|nr:DUF4340 domain-containing protein [Gemmatimonadota bacterium]MCY3942342.1 DUF4340 domain-containing protein [Gemmatimonadota bacterium]
MSRKTLLASLLALAVLTAVYVLVATVGSAEEELPDSGMAAALAKLDSESTERIEFATPTDTFLLQKDGGVWSVNEYEADPTTVSRLLRAFDSAQVAGVASTNPVNHEEMRITDEQARFMVVNEEVAVVWGKHAPYTRTGYARLPGLDTVYFVRGDMRFMVGRSLFEWRNKVMLQVDTAEIQSVAVTADGETTLYERDGGGGWLADREPADTSVRRNTIRNMLQELTEVRASGFEPPEDERPEAPDRVVRAVDARGNEVAHLLLHYRPQNILVMSPVLPYDFEIPNFRYDRIAPPSPAFGDESDDS